MKAYKGFDKDLKCRDFQFEIGKSYEEPSAELCKSGFHACENPLDCFGYYEPANSRYCEVELDDVSDQRESDDSKICGKRITVGAEIGLQGIINAGVKSILDKVDWKDNKVTNTGYQSAATNTGNRSAATNTGDQSTATNTGNQSAATVKGKESCAIALGIEGKAKGGKGCWLTLAEWKNIDGEWHRIAVKTCKVDGKNIKANTFYMLKNGMFCKVQEESHE